MGGPLLIAIHDLPDGIRAEADGATPVCFVQEERGAGERVLCGFSGPETLAAKAPTAVALAVDPATVLDWLIAGDASGLVLDPAGPSAFVSQDDARELLGLPRREEGPHRAGLRGAAEQLLLDVLTGMLDPASGRQHATVREATTGKALRFERGDGDTVRMVLGAEGLSCDERERAAVLFEEFAGGAADLPPRPDTPEPGPERDFVALFTGDAARPARAAAKVFGWVFGFPPGFTLERP